MSSDTISSCIDIPVGRTDHCCAAAAARGIAQMQVKLTIINVNVKIIKGPKKMFLKSTTGYVTTG